MILVICVSALIIMAGGAVYYRSLEALAFALGAFLSSALNVLKVIMLERNVLKILDMKDAGEGKSYIRFQYLIRYVLTGALLVAAALIPFINIWGAIIGVLTMQVAVILIRYMKVDEGPPEISGDGSGGDNSENPGDETE